MLTNFHPLKRTATVLLLTFLISVLAVPGLALAESASTTSSVTVVSSDSCESPTSNQYDDATGQITTCVKTDKGGGSLDGNVGPLPFTGFDVIAMAAVALAVTGLGLALQRAVSRHATNVD